MTSEAKATGQVEALQAAPKARFWAIDFLLRLRRDPLGMFGLFGVLLFLVLAVVAPWVSPHSPTEMSFPLRQAPTLAHPFGTDTFGRDMFSRVLRATPNEVMIGLGSVLIGTALATLVGLVSGYMGGIIDSIIQRIVDMLLAFPSLILLMVLASVLTPSTRSLMIALVIGSLPGGSRIIRGAVLTVRNNDYIEAAQVLGASSTRIMFRHILPQIVPFLIVIVSIMIPAIALLAAALSFLGLGLPPPNPSWGAEISTARGTFPHYMWLAIFPGAVLSLYVLSFNLLGDSMRDILDPRLRGFGH